MVVEEEAMVDLVVRVVRVVEVVRVGVVAGG
jgi:hypothetical protein